MEKVVPVLQIDDGDAAKAYYIDRLGFELDFEWRHEPGFPVFMGVKKGDLYLHLSEHGKGHSGTEIYVFVDDVNAWRATCEKNGVAISQPLEAKPWGSTEMAITDPSRNLLRISQMNTHESTATSA
jgi:uncharacterized glyoxalase superfamily protein PhnB